MSLSLSSDIRCPVFSKCGGCTSLDVPYADQLIHKHQQIEGLFQDICNKDFILPIKGMEDPFCYRNKVITPFVAGRKDKRGRQTILSGMYQAGSHKIIECNKCVLENPLAQEIISAIKQIMRKHNIDPYDEDKGRGFLRHAVIRIGHKSQEVLVTLVTNTREFPYAKSFCRELVKSVPSITTVVQNVNMRCTNVVLGQEEHVLYGPGFILDKLCGLSFRISSRSFYQVNSVQTEVLYRSAIDMAAIVGNETLLDAYCGTGTIGIVAAAEGGAHVIGVDNAKSSIRDAAQNAKHNGIKNAEFVCADAAEFLSSFRIDGACTLMMDPPRAGSSENFLKAVTKCLPERIVYISCNPRTQVRDVVYLVKRGYSIESIQPVDMFPHTDHIENIVSMSLE